MHDTAIQNGQRFFETYLHKAAGVTVVDIGAQDVNGSLKNVCPSDAKYIGVDFVAGKGVDVILEDPYKLPFENDSIDVIVSSSCFEHSQMFWLLYLEIMRVLKPTGLFYLNSPSNGPFHRYPVDCWRFYPDCGGALVHWGATQGLNGAVLESYVCNQYREAWNDFVCVFLKDAAHRERFPSRILDSFEDFTNGQVQRPNGQVTRLNGHVASVAAAAAAPDLRNPSIRPQDQSYRGWKLHKQVQGLWMRVTGR